MKPIAELKVDDTLYRQTSVKEQCTIKSITRDKYEKRIFDFGGFLVSQDAMSKIFKNTGGVFEVKCTS
jgi:hypothetical protein